MAVLAADRNTEFLATGHMTYPMGDDIIYAGSMVVLNTSGYAVAAPVAASTAGMRFLGIAVESVDNSGGSAGDKTIEVDQDTPFEMTGTGLAITDVGKPALLADDNNFSIISGGASLGIVPIGKVLKYISATSAWIDPKPATHGYMGIKQMNIPIELSALADSEISSFTMNDFGLIIGVEFSIVDLVTTASKASTLTLKIESTVVTSVSLALTSAGLDAVGDKVTSALPTGENWFVPGDVLHIFGASTTAFAEGSGVLTINYIS